MTQAESKPTNAPKIILQSLSWDHTTRTAEAKIENALRFWRGLHGTHLYPNVCFVPANEDWAAEIVDGIEVRPTAAQLSGQIVLALVEVAEIDSSDGASERSAQSPAATNLDQEAS